MVLRSYELSRREWLAAVGMIIGVNALGAIPAAVVGSDTGWIDLPWFYPPTILFPVVWTLLFTLLGIALFLVWRATRLSTLEGRLAVGAFAVQFTLNIAWTPVFFGLQRPDLGLFVIGALWLAIVATIAAFDRVCRPAAILLVPYLAWVSFAFVLNYAIYASFS